MNKKNMIFPIVNDTKFEKDIQSHKGLAHLGMTPKVVASSSSFRAPKTVPQRSQFPGPSGSASTRPGSAPDTRGDPSG